MMNLIKSKVLVDFAGSMIGKCLVTQLREIGADVIAINHQSSNLLNPDDCNRILADFQPDYIIHGASTNGSIAYNLSNPADILGETIYQGINILGLAVIHKVKKVVNLISSCAYAPSDLPLQEMSFFDGQPDASVFAHGHAKRTLVAYSRALHKQYQFNCVNVIFNNCYGYAPFDRPCKLKVADQLIMKFVHAKYNNDASVIVWGNGSPKRELLFCEDAAMATIKVLQQYDDALEPINIGCSKDISIKDLAFLIKDLVGYTGEIIFDTSKPNGQMRKLLDNRKMLSILKWEPPTKLKDGLSKTIQYYIDNYIKK